MALLIEGPVSVDSIPAEAVPGPRLTGPVAWPLRCDACGRATVHRWPHGPSLRIFMCARHRFLMQAHLTRWSRTEGANWWMENPGWYRRAHARACRRDGVGARETGGQGVYPALDGALLPPDVTPTHGPAARLAED